jgi:PIN domain nuclease of toxin-antitoxin system
VILLDTHVLLWMSLDPRRLSKTASLAIQEARSKGVICISDITLWEIALLARRGRIQISGTFDSFVQEIALPVVIKPITAAIACMAVQFPEEYPKDPADRLIGATSSIENLPLITADESLRRFMGLNTVW